MATGAISRVGEILTSVNGADFTSGPRVSTDASFTKYAIGLWGGMFAF